MKRWIGLLLTVVLLLAGCGRADDFAVVMATTGKEEPFAVTGEVTREAAKRMREDQLEEWLETDGVDMKFTGIVPAGRVLVDGLGVGDVGSIVLRDRKHLAQDGLMVVVTTIDSATGEVIAGPDIVSRGFVYVREAEEMMAEAKRVCQKALEECRYGNVREWGAMKQAIKDQLGQYLFSKTKRNPMILPVIQEV